MLIKIKKKFKATIAVRDGDRFFKKVEGLGISPLSALDKAEKKYKREFPSRVPLKREEPIIKLFQACWEEIR